MTDLRKKVEKHAQGLQKIVDEQKIKQIDHEFFNHNIDNAMLALARYKANVITKHELIETINQYNDVLIFVDNHLTE